MNLLDQYASIIIIIIIMFIIIIIIMFITIIIIITAYQLCPRRSTIKTYVVAPMAQVWEFQNAAHLTPGVWHQKFTYEE